MPAAKTKMSHRAHRKTTSRAATRILLDSSSYPHLMDMIIGFAPVPSLAALRAASRLLRDKIDRMLFRHVAIISDSATIHRRGLDLTTSRHSTLPVRPHDDYVPYCPRKVEILDLEQPLTAPLPPASYGIGGWTSLATLRRMGAAVYGMPSHFSDTLDFAVDFLDLTSIVPRDGARHEPLSISVPPAARYILHLKWDESDEHWRHITFRGHHISRAWTIVLWPCRPGTRPICEFPICPHFFPSVLLGAVAASGWMGQVTIVGAEKINPLQLGGAGDDSNKDRKGLFTTALHAISPELAGVGLLSHDEWSKTLRERTLYGEWPPEGRLYICTDCRRAVFDFLKHECVLLA
ncbi:hypothetical protein Q8F55_000012 [Vanrija albida]|uniref:F-box domain-containing protein n=1 Tax=Vanrija albida TaxID=181172 RepID=A0ABR3QC22_9TREE